jgi:uncharacterized protein (DUF849 family)
MIPGMLKCCLNGARRAGEHPACPTTAAALARDASTTVAAGAGALHVHPRDPAGRESLDGRAVGEAVAAIRAAVDVPVGVTTGAWVVPDPGERLRAIERWEVLPDFASVNLHEAGAIEAAELLLDRGVGVEAGVWHPEAAGVLADSGLADRCLRILLEPMEPELPAALATVGRIEERLGGAAAGVPRLLHGTDRTAWALLAEAGRRGWQARIGLEDTLLRPDGRRAAGNEELVRLAVERLGGP